MERSWPLKCNCGCGGGGGRKGERLGSESINSAVAPLVIPKPCVDSAYCYNLDAAILSGIRYAA